MTKRIYDVDAYCREFKARVLSCEKNGDGYEVVLDKTAFFPEGGGQAADKGTIDGIEVYDVQIKDGNIVHKTHGMITVGIEAECKLDWELRFARMQSHSGEHIVSGIVHSRFGFNNVGFHMSGLEMTVDFDGILTQTDIDELEKLANFAVYSNAKITVSYPTTEESAQIDFRSKLDDIEDLRLVTIEGVDCCACCAPHVSRTGEIGVIKIIDFTPDRGGTRLTVLAGFEAFCDYSRLNSSNKRLMKSLSSPRATVAENAERYLELAEKLREENGALARRLAWSELAPERTGDGAYAFAEKLTYDELRHCSNMLSDEGCELCLLFSSDGTGKYIYVVSSKERDTRSIVKRLNESFDGRGGGKPNYAQGIIAPESRDAVEAFVTGILNEG